MGIILTTTGWTGASIEVVHASGTETFTISGDTNNAYDVATDFATWLDAGARAWAGALTSVSWTVEDNGDGRVCFVYAAVGTTFTSFTCDAEAAERIRVSKTSVSSGASGTCRGSCSAIPGSRVWERWDIDQGARNRLASWRMGHPLLAHRRPSIELAMDLYQTFALCEAVRIAAQPRTAYVYDEAGATWRLVTVGRHMIEPHTADDTTKTIGTLDVLGGV